MRYQIEIRTSERTGAGTDARVYLSLAGDKYAMAEAEIDDPITANDWERGDVNSLFIESADLGDIVRGKRAVVARPAGRALELLA